MQIESRWIRILSDGNGHKKQELLKHCTSEKELNKTINKIKSYGLNFIEEGDNYPIFPGLGHMSRGDYPGPEDKEPGNNPR